MAKEKEKPVAEESPEDKVAKIKQMLATIGLDLTEVAALLVPEVAKLLAPEMAQAAAATLNEMKIPDIITSTIDEKVTAKTDALGLEVKAVLEQIQANQTGVPGPGANVQQTQEMNPIAQALLMKAIGGGGDGGDPLGKALDNMVKLQNIGVVMYQNPLSQAMQMLTGMLKVGMSAGIPNDKLAEGLENIVAKPTIPGA